MKRTAVYSIVILLLCDGKFDATVFRPSSSVWYVNKSTGGNLIQTFGIAGDKPLPNAFVP